MTNYPTFDPPNETYYEIIVLGRSVGWVSDIAKAAWDRGEYTDEEIVRMAHPLPDYMRPFRHNYIAKWKEN